MFPSCASEVPRLREKLGFGSRASVFECAEVRGRSLIRQRDTVTVLPGQRRIQRQGVRSPIDRDHMGFFVAPLDLDEVPWLSLDAVAFACRTSLLTSW